MILFEHNGQIIETPTKHSNLVTVKKQSFHGHNPEHEDTGMMLNDK